MALKSKMLSINNLNRAEDIVACVMSFLAALVFVFNSPLHPWVKAEPFPDSSVFKTVAIMMERGYMPYRDSFDHKGPLLYILNWLGNKISSYSGIWVIEIMCIGITFFVLYKISRLSCGVVSSVITCFAATSLLFIYYEGGNLSEEYAMPCIAVGVYIFLDYLLNNVISKRRLVISGICCGSVLLLRPNMITVWIVYCIAISAFLLCKKDVKNWARFALWFFVGMALIIAPVIIWLSAKNDLSYFFNDYIVFNMKYASAEGGRAFMSSRWKSFFTFFNTNVFIAAFFSMIFHLKEKMKVCVTYIIYLVVTVMLMVMSGMSYGHYGMILIPAMAYPISLIFADVERIKDDNIKKALFLIVSLYALSVVIAPDWIETAEGIAGKYEARNEIHRTAVTNDIVNRVSEFTNEDDRISVYGSWDIIYILSNRAHATRYSYQFPIGQVVPEIMNDYMYSLQEELPKAIVIQSGRYDDSIKAFLSENNYAMLYSSDSDDLSKSSMLFIKQ